MCLVDCTSSYLGLYFKNGETLNLNFVNLGKKESWIIVTYYGTIIGVNDSHYSKTIRPKKKVMSFVVFM